MNSRFLLIAVLATVASPTACTSGSEAERARVETGPSPTTTASTPTTVTGQPAANVPQARAIENCSTRSEADFTGAFDDPTNLVAGPLVLVGGARPTSPAVIEAHSGQKFPLLVRAGHNVTVRVPDSAQGRVALGYGWLPQGLIRFRDGYPAVRFVACEPDGPSSSTAGAGELVTFWSGFVLVREPSCAPLDVYVDGESSPRRIAVTLGEPC